MSLKFPSMHCFIFSSYTHSSIPAWKNPTDRGACRATVHKVPKSRTQLSNWARRCFGLPLRQASPEDFSFLLLFGTWIYSWFLKHQVSSVQSLSHVWLLGTPWTAAHQASLSITNSQSLPKLISSELVMPSNHLILCRPLLLPCSIFPSIRVFSNELALHIRWPKYWSFSFNISPSNEHSGLISFRMDWLDFLEVQGTLKSLLQHHSSKTSILQCSAFFIAQLHIHTWLLEKPKP